MLQEKKKLSLNTENLYNYRGRNVTPPKYTNAKTNYTASPISYRTKDLTPNSKSRSRLALGDEGGSNERQEELISKAMQEKDNNKIYFKDLLYCICDFQMIQHEKYLHRFVALFKSADKDKDGIINESQFRYLIRQMKIIPPSISDCEQKTEEEIDRLLVIIDPHKTQQITFSELVTFLTMTEFSPDDKNKDLVISITNSEIKNNENENETEQNSLSLLDKVNEATD